jgi:hypothetical protein
MSDYDTLDLGHGEIIETSPAFWRDPDRLRHAAQRLQALAAQPLKYRFEPVEHDPYEPPERRLADQIDAPFDPEAESKLKTAIAMGQIRAALREEERQAQQQQEQVRADALAKAQQTPLGRLLTRRRY